MHTYRLVIRRHDKPLGHFESSTPWSREAVEDIAARLPAADGYRLELLIANGERRLLESGPDGIRVLSTDLIFTTTSLDD
ncbi:cytoplasmic protein [Acidovorax sp. SDU_ACID1]|uniref:cytoplasmic protein n=1 Tax=Acidovorax sp. SDU_ACID1 TaxID=3136632 RepID=UPI0038731164